MAQLKQEWSSVNNCWSWEMNEWEAHDTILHILCIFEILHNKRLQKEKREFSV